MANFSREEVIEKINDYLESMEFEGLEFIHNEICTEEIKYLGNGKFESDDYDD